MAIDRLTDTETTIRWTAFGDNAELWTTSDIIADEWRALGLSVGQYIGRGAFAHCPKSWVTIRPPKGAKK